MKLKIPVLCLALCALSFPLFAEEVAPAAAEEVEERLIPTEISEPPYEVGELPSKEGYYIERPGQTSINFRIVANKMRVYWIDQDGLIAEPESTGGNVRLKGKPKIRSYFGLDVAGTGLAGEGIVRPPHFFNVVLYLENEEGKEADVHTFRYVISMGAPAESEEPTTSSYN